MPKPYAIETSVHIDAPAKKIYDVLLDLNQFDEWNPFKLFDDSNVSTVQQAKPGVGSVYEYQGNKVGKGRQEVIEVVKPTLIKHQMTFFNKKGKAEKAFSEYRLHEDSTGTVVTWAMNGERSVGQSLFISMLGLNKMMAKSFAQGLERLKDYVEEGA